MPDTTITYDESVKGFTSFHSFIPDWMIGMNNSFFSIRDGQLYRHNAQIGARNTFYGIQYPSQVGFNVNQSPSEIKVLKAVSQESTSAWETQIQAFQGDQNNFTQSTITQNEFVDKEGKKFAYTRRNELPDNRNSKAYYGLGRVTDIVGNDVTFNDGGVTNSALTVGDNLYNGNTNTLVGEIQGIDSENNILTLSAVAGLAINNFVFGAKPTRIEGAQMRGYNFRLDLEITSSNFEELFAVNSEVMISEP